MSRYGAAHAREREAWRPRVDAGIVRCWRCKELIQPGEPWDMGHRDGSRRDEYAGPEHTQCNRRTKTHAANQSKRPTPRHPGAIGATP